jgi:hypothetical protein
MLGLAHAKPTWVVLMSLFGCESPTFARCGLGRGRRGGKAVVKQECT